MRPSFLCVCSHRGGRPCPVELERPFLSQSVRNSLEGLTMTEVAVGALGEEWRGHVVCISSEDDYQAIPMKPGVLTHCRGPLLLSKGHSCYRPRTAGERKCKSVGMYQGCQPEWSQLGCAWPYAPAIWHPHQRPKAMVHRITDWSLYKLLKTIFLSFLSVLVEFFYYYGSKSSCFFEYLVILY